MKKTYFYNIALFIFFAALTIALTYPSILFLPDKLIGTDGDNYQFLSFQYLGQKLFYAGHFPFGHTDFWRYPVGINFPSSIDSYLFILLGIPFYLFFKNPVLIYNLSILLLLFLNFILAYFSFRQFFPKTLSVIGAVMYGSSFYVISKLGGHPNLLLTSVFPFLFSSWYYFYKTGGNKKSLILIFTSALLIAFTSLQYLLIAAGVVPILAFFLYYFYNQEFHDFLKLIYKKRFKLLIIAATLAITISIFYSTKIEDTLTGNLQLPIKETVYVNPINLFFPNPYLNTVSSFMKNNELPAIESVIFIGFAEVIIFILVLIFIPNSKIKKFLLGFIFTIFIISLGTQAIFKNYWPYQYLFNFFPYRGIIEPSRFYVIYFLGFTFLVLYSLQRIKRKSILLLILALLVMERLPYNFSFNQYIRNMDFIPTVQAAPSNAVLDLPLYFDYWNGYFYNFYSAYYEKPIVAGYIHWSGDDQRTKETINLFHDLTCYNQDQISQELKWKRREDFLYYLKQENIRTVVFHKDISFYKCELGKENIIYYLAHEKLKLIFEDTHTSVYYLK